MSSSEKWSDFQPVKCFTLPAKGALQRSLNGILRVSSALHFMLQNM
ncbi:Hypothetical protein ABZS17D1_04145 [Kosakonia cowanii]